jgi:hypothetical protein
VKSRGIAVKSIGPIKGILDIARANIALVGVGMVVRKFRVSSVHGPRRRYESRKRLRWLESMPLCLISKGRRAPEYTGRVIGIVTEIKASRQIDMAATA